ncbi:hypothetical protein ELH46_16360 [Rhizobium ruizarguesonis]|nr:hypothetical protein ELH46_16360 [Rhizobium ruizarguesonis]
MRDDEDNPSMSRGLLRVGTLCLVVVLISYFFWDMFSESAALRRLAATAKNYRYAERCDADGNSIATGQPNCVDLNHDGSRHARTNKKRADGYLRHPAVFGIPCPCQGYFQPGVGARLMCLTTAIRLPLLNPHGLVCRETSFIPRVVSLLN